MAKETKTPKAPDVPNPGAEEAGATEGTAAAETATTEAAATETAATEAKADQPAAAGKVIEKQTIKVLYVVAKRESFRRAGFAFGSERTRLVVDGLTDEQVKQLIEEPMLVVTEATE